MQSIFQDWKAPRYLGKYSVIFLPMIDMNPGDFSSWILYLSMPNNTELQIPSSRLISYENLQHNTDGTANSDLREANRQNRSLFHAEMSFLGSISHLIEESGFREILKLIYLSIKFCGPRKSTESSSDRMQQHFSPVWSWQGNSPVEIWEFILFRKQAYVSRCHCYTCYMYYAVLAIFLAGEKALVFLFGVKPVIGLDALRHWQNL